MRWGSAAVRWVYFVCKHPRGLTQAGRLWGGFRAAAFGVFATVKSSKVPSLWVLDWQAQPEGWAGSACGFVGCDCFPPKYCIGYPLFSCIKFKE